MAHLLNVLAALLISLVLFGTASAVPDCTDLPVYVSKAQCQAHADYGAADVAIERLRLIDFSRYDKDVFRTVLANVSNKYYPSITIVPDNIAIVELFDSREGVLTLSFFVMNPSNSEYFPILFRTTELNLMIELNLDFINLHLPYDIKPQPPEDTYPLFFPVWAIVIIVYLLIVVIGFLIVLATRNWNDAKKGMVDIEAESVDGGGAVLLTKTYNSYSQDDYAVVQRKRTRTNSSLNNNITEVDHHAPDYKDQSEQTPRTVSMQVRANDIDKTTLATIEKEPDSPPPDYPGKLDSSSEEGGEEAGDQEGDGNQEEEVNQGEDNDGYESATEANATTQF